MNYTKEYFIEKFSAIPDRGWYDGGDLKHPQREDCGCALYHCGVKPDESGKNYIPTEEALALIKILNKEEPIITAEDLTHTDHSFKIVYRINDGAFDKGMSPKNAILEALEKL